MSQASSPADARAESRTERLQHWIAALSSALLHLLFVLIALWLSPVNVTPPQGSAAGSRMAVDFIGKTPPPPTPKPTPRKVEASKPAAASRVQTTAVAHSDDPMPDNNPDDAAQGDSQAAAAATPPPAPTQTLPRRSRIWGQPPGMMAEDHAAENAGLARSPATQRGRGNDSVSGPSMEVGGYQVYYDLRSETRLRTWRDQGMTEVFLPLPGSRRYMACPLETALKRESGPCRLIEPDSPELANIGDAREAINMQKVFRMGEVVWSGPGAYR